MPRFIGSQSLARARSDSSQFAANASVSESNAAQSAIDAANSASSASQSASTASGAATSATSSDQAALTYANNASASLTAFRGDYLGDHANDTAADSYASSNSYTITVGTLYFNSTNNEVRVCTATGSPNTFQSVNAANVAAGRYLQTTDGNNVIDAGPDIASGAKTTTDLVIGTVGGTARDLRVTGSTTLDGDLTVNGTTTTVNTATLDVADNQITLNSDLSSNSAPTQDAGIVVNRGNATDKTLVWDETADKWTVGTETFVAGTVEANVTGNVTGQVSTLTNHSTDDLSEGSTNKYFSGKTSDDLPEGSTNEYFSDTKFNTKFSAKDTDDLSEGTTNQYYTQVRFNTDFATKTTDSLSEGTQRFYYTDERVDDRVDALIQEGEAINKTYDDANGTMTIAVEDSSATNKGAVIVSGTAPVTVTYSSGTANLSIPDASTSQKGVADFNPNEFSTYGGTVSVKTDGIDNTHIDFGTGTNQVNTDQLTEGSTNLYHTDARAFGSLVAGAGISLDANNRTIAATGNVEALSLAIALG